MEIKRAKAFAIVGGTGLSIIAVIHALLSYLEVAPLGAAWAGFYMPWVVFLIIGALGLKLRQGDSA